MTGLNRRTLLAGAAGAAIAPGMTHAAPAGTLRLATLKFGTVNWELETIRREGLDVANGFSLEVLGMASSAATKIAFEGESAESLVADWLWVARQRGEGRDFVFTPYSRAVGALIVPENSAAKRIEDLAGKRIGIAGGPLDKSWLILRGFARSRGFDLVAETEQVFGAPPLIMQQALAGGVDAVINYWHFEARMRAKGFRPLVSVEGAAESMGLPTEIPLLGYIFRQSYIDANPEIVSGFLKASRAAKTLLATDDAAWDALRPRMNAADDAEFAALVAGFRVGIPDEAPVDAKAAARLFALLAELGGKKLVGTATTLPPGVFHDSSS